MQREIERLFAAGQHADVASLIASVPEEALSALPPATLLMAAIACSIVGLEQQAESLFVGLLQRYPQCDDARLNLGVLRLQQKRYAEALSLLKAYQARCPGSGFALYNLGLVQFALGDYRDSARWLGQHLQRVPNDASARLYLARCAIELEDHETARQLRLNLRLEWFDGLREQYEFARLLSALNEFDAASAVYRHIASQFPEELPARVNLAAICERIDRVEEGLALLADAEQSARDSHQFWLTRARLLGTSNQSSEALEALDRARWLLPTSLPAPERDSFLSEVEFERGQNLDRLSRHAEAYEAFARGNALAQARFRMISGRTGEGGPGDGEGDDPTLDAIVLNRYRMGEATDTPIFMVGFPRSGTTLLDQILDAHPQLQVMEEKPALETVAQRLTTACGSIGEALRQADSGAYERMQQLYRSEVATYLSRKPSTRLIDKSPLSMARLQLAMAIFPGSQWIFAIRHPCDVVLSCFMQNLRFTPATQGFWSIEQTAETYVRLMTRWLDQRERLKPACLDVRYEDLLRELPAQAARLIDYLHLPWDDRVLRFNEHARTRRIATPSYRQVVKPLYRSSQGRWLHYREQLMPVLPLIRPVAERLGYSVDPDGVD